MQINQISDGRPESLEEFYTEIQSDGTPWDVYGRMMLDLIRYLKEEVSGPSQWAHTSHNYLVLSDIDSSAYGRVWISAPGDLYHIEYYLPVDEAPWPRAKVVGHANDVTEAGQMILSALEHAPKGCN